MNKGVFSGVRKSNAGGIDPKAPMVNNTTQGALRFFPFGVSPSTKQFSSLDKKVANPKALTSKTIVPSVTDNAFAWVSVPGIKTNGATYYYSAAAYNGSSLWAITDMFGTIQTSTDLVTWTSVASNMSNGVALYDIAYGNNVWVAVGQSGNIRRSTDGVTWATQTSNTASNLYFVEFGNGLFVAGGVNAALRRSTDGVTWVTASLSVVSFTSPIYGVAYGNGIWAGMNGANHLILSTDALTWYGQGAFPFSEAYASVRPAFSVPSSSLQKSPIIFANDKFAVSATKNYVYSIATAPATLNSPGFIWASLGLPTPVVTPTTYEKSLIFASNAFYTCGSNGIILKSTDAFTWTTQTSNFGTSTVNSLAYANNQIIAVGAGGTIRTSTDGTTWVTQTSNTTATLYNIVYGNGVWVATGTSGVLRRSADSGVTWTTQTSNIANNITVAVYGGGKFLATHNTASPILVSSTDGLTWSTVAYSGSLYTIQSMTYGNGRFVAVGMSGVVTTSTDGVTWTSVYSGSKGVTWYSATYYNNTFMLSGAASYFMSSTDGVTWTTTGTTQYGTSIATTAYGNGFWLASMGGSGFLVSGANLTWTLQPKSTWASSMSLVSGNGIVLAYAGGMLQTSTDYVSWVQQKDRPIPASLSNGTFFITYAANTWVLAANVAYNGTGVLTSPGSNLEKNINSFSEINVQTTNSAPISGWVLQ